MGYERTRLAKAVVEALTRTPTATLKYISATLGVERQMIRLELQWMPASRAGVRHAVNRGKAERRAGVP